MEVTFWTVQSALCMDFLKVEVWSDASGWYHHVQLREFTYEDYGNGGSWWEVVGHSDRRYSLHGNLEAQITELRRVGA